MSTINGIDGSRRRWQRYRSHEKPSFKTLEIRIVLILVGERMMAGSQSLKVIWLACFSEPDLMLSVRSAISKRSIALRLLIFIRVALSVENLLRA